jgi:uncharacterized protein
MAHYYLDSSALVKRYVSETGTTWIRQLCDPQSQHTIYTVRISGAEIVAALFLRVRTGSVMTTVAQSVARQFRNDFQHAYRIVEVSPGVVEHAMDLAESQGLRGYDSVQLAAALVLQDVRLSLGLSPITFLCADKQLNQAARAEGMIVDNPDNYP